jgi:glycosyltransferase involved in cell wall biosynthesis
LSSFVLVFGPVRILLDYRPALRERTGVGEFVHQLARALAASAPIAADDLTLLTTSWKDRLSPAAARELPGVTVIDRRVPVRALAWAWNRLEWPPVEWFAGTVDVVHSQTPLLIPAKQAAKVVTIHDLHFLSRPDHSEGEIRRDFPELVHDHASRADQVVVSSHYAAAEVIRRLGVASARVSVCSPGAPPWAAEVRRERADSFGETILFVGTLEPRKNIGGLLTAYERLLDLRPDAPPLVLAGRPRQSVATDLERAHRPPLAGRVNLLGYVTNANRQLLFRRARMLVLPSFEEGFGLPVLEAMACGVPVVVSNRGSLPEVAGEAASPVDPDDPVALAREMARLLEPDAAREASARGLAQSSQYTWDACASAARAAYRAAVAARVEHRR